MFERALKREPEARIFIMVLRHPVARIGAVDLALQIVQRALDSSAHTASIGRQHDHDLSSLRTTLIMIGWSFNPALAFSCEKPDGQALLLACTYFQTASLSRYDLLRTTARVVRMEINSWLFR